MALKPCRECKKEVSTEAKTCPHCGTSHPTGRRTSLVTMGCLVLIVLVVIVSMVGGNTRDTATAGLRARGVGYLKDASNNRIRTYELPAGATETQVRAHASSLTSTPGQMLAAYYYPLGSTIPADGVTLAGSVPGANEVLYHGRGLSKWKYAYMKYFRGTTEFVDCDASPRSGLCRQ